MVVNGPPNHPSPIPRRRKHQGVQKTPRGKERPHSTSTHGWIGSKPAWTHLLGWRRPGFPMEKDRKNPELREVSLSSLPAPGNEDVVRVDVAGRPGERRDTGQGRGRRVWTRARGGRGVRRVGLASRGGCGSVWPFGDPMIRLKAIGSC